MLFINVEIAKMFENDTNKAIVFYCEDESSFLWEFIPELEFWCWRES